MQVTYDKNNGTQREVDLFVLGECLGIADGKNTHRIRMTPSQWKVLAESAQRRADQQHDDDKFLERRGLGDLVQKVESDEGDEGDDSDDPTSVLYEGHRKDQEAVARALARDKRIR